MFTEYGSKEKAVLTLLYEASDGTWSSHTVAQKLNMAFEDARETIERLIGDGLVRGKRFTEGKGVSFDKLKLRSLGEREAIKVKNEGVIVIDARWMLSQGEGEIPKEDR